MPKLKVLSGLDIVKIFNFFSFQIHKQKGSHIKLIRIINNIEKQTLTIPNHSELDNGTIKAIYRQAQKYITENELYPHFYNN